jgi:nucleotide-binding universal stress UspA family protein
MLERLVVPIDFTPESERAIPIAVALASKAQASVELVSVAEPIGRDETAMKLMQAARDSGNAVEWRVLESGGPPEAVLLTEVHRRRQSLWCVGSHTRGALGELLLGSLSEELVREAHEPVLIVGPQAGKPAAGTVLAVALDGTARSEAILPAALDVARDLGMTVRLLEVVQTDTTNLPPDVSETAYLTRVAGKLPSADDVDYDVLHDNDAARGLADYVSREPDVGIVALSTRGLSGSARLLHGSTAFEVAHRVSVPVLILHALEPAD